MKSILISIRPEWLAKTLNGKKNSEICKDAPKDWKDYLSGKTGIKPKSRTVYIYCPEGKELRLHQFEMSYYTVPGEVAHLWLKFQYAYFDDTEDELDEEINKFYAECSGNNLCTTLGGTDMRNETDNRINGKVVAKFTLLNIDKFDMENPYEGQTRAFLNEASVTIGEARTLAGGMHPCYNPLYAYHISNLQIFDKPKELSDFGLKRTPRSWCYVKKD